MTEINVTESDLEDKELLIIDCDPGTDDAIAILLALSPKISKHVHVLGITCVGGNTHIDHVVKNAIRTLKIANRIEIPIFKGASNALIPRDLIRPSRIHGGDGLGGVAEDYPVSNEEVQAVLQRENAVDWIGRTVMKYPSKITLVTLAPLTNVAFAHRLFPHFHSNLKRLVVMGGTTNAKGNMGLTSEFNFGCDPEAAHVVLEEFTCPITLVPFDTCLLHGFPYDWYEQTITACNSMKANFVWKIFEMKNEYSRGILKENFVFYACDWMAMICAINPAGVNVETISHYGTVELQGRLTRGQFVLDWKDTLCGPEGGKRKMDVVVKFDQRKLRELFENMLM